MYVPSQQHDEICLQPDSDCVTVGRTNPRRQTLGNKDRIDMLAPSCNKDQSHYHNMGYGQCFIMLTLDS